MDQIERFVFRDIESPNWESGERVHNWRNHIGDEVRQIWHTFTPVQKLALARAAQSQADGEEWD